MLELSLFDNRLPQLPVEEVDGLFLDTVRVRLDDVVRNEQILDAVQTACGELDPVKEPEGNGVEDVGQPNYGETDDRRDEELVGFADADELKYRLERIRPGSFDELETILSVYVTRATYWQGVPWRDSAGERRLQAVGKAASILLANLGDLTAAGIPLEQWVTADDETRLRKALTALKPLEEFKGFPKRSAPDLVDELAKMLMHWWQTTIGKDPTFWTAPGRQGTPKGASQFMRFVGLVVAYLPHDRRPTASHGTPGLGEQALKTRFKKSAEARGRELALFARLSRLLAATPDDPTGSAAFKHVAKRIAESRASRTTKGR